MPNESKPKPAKDKRIAFTIPDEIASDFDLVKTAVGTKSDAALAEMAAAFAIRAVRAGQLANLNGELVPARNGVPILTEEAA